MKPQAAFIAGCLLAALAWGCTEEELVKYDQEKAAKAAVDASIYMTNANVYPVIEAGDLLFERTNVVFVRIGNDTYMHLTDAEWGLVTNAYKDDLYTVDSLLVYGPPKK